jgi:hypothetical protein
MTSTLKKLIIALVVVVVLAGGFYLYQNSKTGVATTGGLVSDSGAVATAPTGANTDPAVLAAQSRTDELVALLSRVSQITVDTAVMDSPAFGQLIDLSIQLPVDSNPGRPNPFQPIGSELRAVNTPAPAAAATNNSPFGAPAANTF